ncbi:hypothetical protein Cma02nite_21240 [Cellulomonas marina]|uniref:Uncharacterized protein n=1 Tax=Cellulomonas marina TaxID=988821 RepID=A0A1I0X8Z4_9CELL|nr:hypothetical protein Cma02nite_21240 [Cellulomonas marina]SFA97495.1 hypothetical protein SAMN05421867_104218 [Cellulomonas marina]
MLEAALRTGLEDRALQGVPSAPASSGWLRRAEPLAEPVGDVVVADVVIRGGVQRPRRGAVDGVGGG